MVAPSAAGSTSSERSPTEFELHVGRALDTLRADYPAILTEPPDYSIYDDRIEVVDPSGVKVHGKASYKNAFRLLHALVKFIYCPAKSSMQMRMCFDQARHNIRISWNARVVPRDIFGGSRRVVHAAGISVYEFDRETGRIVQHRIERLLLNDAPLAPKEGVVAALREEHAAAVPSFIRQQQRQQQQTAAAAAGFGGTTTAAAITSRPAAAGGTLQAVAPPPSRRTYSLSNLWKRGRRSTRLAAFEQGAGTENASDNNPYPDLDWDAMEAKNRSRKKFGLKPLTPEEFLDLQQQVQQIAVEQEQKIKAAAAASAASKKKSGGGFLDMIGSVLTDTCETNFDCERPEICCDFGFQKRCCASGSPVFDAFNNKAGDPALVPVPVENYPPGQGPNDDPRNY
jgi:hypothetical protein